MVSETALIVKAIKKARLSEWDPLIINKCYARTLVGV